MMWSYARVYKADWNTQGKRVDGFARVSQSIMHFVQINHYVPLCFRELTLFFVHHLCVDTMQHLNEKDVRDFFISH